ncbi:MAG: polymer-forming cytoskeletal protein [Thauera sp.]|nr:polymer-forming cytoskeletal protein [Thauera sp.]
MMTQPIDDDSGRQESAGAGAQRRAAAPAALRLLERSAAPRMPGDAATQAGPDPIAVVAEQIARSRSGSAGAPANVQVETRRVEVPAVPRDAQVAPAGATQAMVEEPCAQTSSGVDPPVESKRAANAAQRSVLVGHSVALHVAMKVPGRLVIDGLVCGEIEADEIELRPGGRLEGRISCRRADLSGRIQGELFVRDRTVVRSTARISGLLVYGQVLQVEAGALLDAALSCSEAGLRKLGEEPRRPRGVDEVASEGAVKQGRDSIFGRMLGAMGLT